MRDLADLSTLDLTQSPIPTSELRTLLPQRHEFELIDGVCHFDPDQGLLVAYKDWPTTPWWARGHVPDRPLMPGVLMIEGCAQAATILVKRTIPELHDVFIGLGGTDAVRLRGTVPPGSRIHFITRTGTVSGSRMFKYPAQAFCDDKRIADMQVIGVRL